MKLSKKLYAVAGLGLAAMGLGGGLAASAASAQGTTVYQASAQLTSTTTVAPGIVVYNWNLYQQKNTAPGYTLVATESETCVQGPLNLLCNWRVTTVATKAAPSAELVGNAVITTLGQTGAVQGGTGAWAHAKGIMKSQNYVPGVTNASFVFSTP